MTAANKQRATFTQMENGNGDDWSIIMNSAMQHAMTLPERVLSHLKLLENDFGGFAIDRLQHSLQTATRAVEDGRDDEYVVCALLHDIGDTLGPLNHAEIAATILQPYVSEKNHWMVQQHGVFQGYYFFHYVGLDRDMRDQFKDHEYFDYTEEFCRKYDQNSFDENYTTMPLVEFEPVLRDLLTKPKNSIYLEE